MNTARSRTNKSTNSLKTRLRVNKNGRPVYEQELVEKFPFYIGSRLSCDFNLPKDYSINHTKLFQREKENVIVAVQESFDGWLYIDGQKLTIDEILGGKRRKRVSLDQQGYGKIIVGQFTFSIDHIPEPTLPFSDSQLKENIKNLDWTLVYFIVPILLFQLFICIYFSLRPKRVSLPEIQYEMVDNRFKKLLILKDTKKASDSTGPKTDKKRRKAPKGPALKTAAPKSPKKGRSKAKLSAKQMAKVRRVGLLGLLGSKGGSSSNKLLSGSNQKKLDNALGNVVGGKNISKALSASSAKMRSGDVKHMGIGKVGGLGGGRSVNVGVVVDSEISIGGGGGDGGLGGGGEAGYDVSGANKVVMRNLGAIRFCYEQALRKRSDIAGDFVLEFTVLPSGRPSNIDVIGAESVPMLVQCIQRRFRRLKFPKPVGGSVDLRKKINLRSNL